MSLHLAIAGLGTVGAETVRLLQQDAALYAARAGQPLIVTAVSARTQKDRGFSMDGIRWVEDARELATLDTVDVVVELIGGAEGVARELCESALAQGKPVVTANKALVAHHGMALAETAEANGAPLMFEAAVAGGIPVIKALREGLTANRVARLSGILNGTGNYILTTMEATGREFDDVLAEAQALGYAEADPTFDVDGIDTAHKLAILSALAFGTAIQPDGVQTEGIRAITAEDIANARTLGYRIKLLGRACLDDDGRLQQHVHPCMVPVSAPIAQVDKALNAVHMEGHAVGESLLMGEGAGAGPTASAVIADLIDIARGITPLPFSVPVATLKHAAPADARETANYLRLRVKDEAGTLADIADIFRDAAISVQRLRQKEPPASAREAAIVLTTRRAPDTAMHTALERIAALPAVLDAPQRIRIAV